MDNRIILLSNFANRQLKICELPKIDIDIALKNACKTMNTLARQEIDHAQQLFKHIDTTYKQQTNKRRGLIDGLGSIAKSLFGVMDANDDKLIKEQLALIENQDIISHATKNQLHVLNVTIAHIQKLEENIQSNENLLVNTTQRIRHSQEQEIEREELNEHFMILSTMITNLIRNLEDITEYLLYAKNGMLHPRLTPTRNIIDQFVTSPFA